MLSRWKRKHQYFCKQDRQPERERERRNISSWHNTGDFRFSFLLALLGKCPRTSRVLLPKNDTRRSDTIIVECRREANNREMRCECNWLLFRDKHACRHLSPNDAHCRNESTFDAINLLDIGQDPCVPRTHHLVGNSRLRRQGNVSSVSMFHSIHFCLLLVVVELSARQ